MSGQPDGAKYEILVEQLLEIERRAAAAEIDPLGSSLEALQAVLAFLNADARIFKGEGTRSLGRLSLALYDRLRGAKPTLFFAPIERNGETGAPSLTSAIFFRTLVVSAHLSLLVNGFSKEEASKWVAAELRRSGTKQPNGRPVSARAVERWHAELGGKSLKGSDWAFGQFVRGAQHSLENAGGSSKPSDAPPNPAKAPAVAEVFIKILRVVGF
jgi:hypothetical protein